MPTNSLPTLPITTISQTKIDRLGWTAGQSFTAYGLRFGLRVNDPAALTQAIQHLPLGWQPFDYDQDKPLDDARDKPASTGEVDILYSLRQGLPDGREGQRNYHLLFCGSALVARSLEFSQLLEAFQKHAEFLTALRAQDCLFVHAGVVGWQGKAILIPGRTMTGKTTLVKALVEAGASYYSDEFAVLDKTGRVHPYPAPLSIRGARGQTGIKTPVEALGGQAGVEPLPVGLIIVTQYQRGARWRPRPLSPAQALLALMDNTVAAQREPQYTMPILCQAVLGAKAIQSKRGEVERAARALLRQLASGRPDLIP